MSADWMQAQVILAQVAGGKVTPGSGNGRIKGDVIKEGVVFEVKQTSKQKLTLPRKWFNKLLRQAKSNKAVLVIFFELRGYAYVHSYDSGIEFNEWGSMTITEKTLPSEIYSKDGSKWVLTQLTNLRQL